MTLDHMETRHQRACHMLGCTLTLGADAPAWEGLSTVLLARLTPLERSLLLSAVIRAVDAGDALFVIERSHVSRLAGSPLPVLDEIDDDARWWADHASPAELRSWLAACFVRLSPRDRADFLDAAMGRAAA
jgi:hypothetical protein